VKEFQLFIKKVLQIYEVNLTYNFRKQMIVEIVKIKPYEIRVLN